MLFNTKLILEISGFDVFSKLANVPLEVLKLYNYGYTAFRQSMPLIQI
jgi:hypothetical protein